MRTCSYALEYTLIQGLRASGNMFYFNCLYEWLFSYIWNIAYPCKVILISSNDPNAVKYVHTMQYQF